MSALADEDRSFRERGTGLVDLAPRAHLLFTGPDRVQYLNGQLTANLIKAKSPSVLPACVSTAKGKLCAEVFVTVGAEAIVLDAESMLAESLAARLEKYIVADDVQLAVIDEPSPRFHVIGALPESFPAEWRGALCPGQRFGRPGWDVLPSVLTETTASAAAANAWLQAQVPVLSPALLELLCLEHGVPRWGAELDENTFPSEAGIDRTHVDFHKGCYIGQEVISRLRSVGQATRGLRGFTADAPLVAGSRLFTADDPARDLGRITSAGHSFALDRSIGLGYLRRSAPETGLLAASPDAPDAPVPVSLHPLPFVS